MRSTAHIRQRAKTLRTTLSPPERLLWTRLRARGEERVNFRRQHPFGPYVLDFYCATARLVIEIDGQSHGHGDQPGRDKRRDAYLASQGLHVIRYPASELMRDPNGVAQAIFDMALGLSARAVRGGEGLGPLRHGALRRATSPVSLCETGEENIV